MQRTCSTSDAAVQCAGSALSDSNLNLKENKFEGIWVENLKRQRTVKVPKLIPSMNEIQMLVKPAPFVPIMHHLQDLFAIHLDGVCPRGLLCGNQRSAKRQMILQLLISHQTHFHAELEMPPQKGKA